MHAARGPRPGPAMRAVRAVTLALVVLSLATLAHAGGGSALPGAGQMAALGGVLAATAWFALALPASPARLIALTVGGQVVGHAALLTLAPPAHVHAEPMSMTALHLAAAVVVGAWLAVGERALVSLLATRGVRALERLTRAPAYLACDADLPRPGAARSRAWALRATACWHDALPTRVGARRGPPPLPA